MPKTRTFSGELVWPRHDPIPWQVTVRDDFATWDQADQHDWLDATAASLYTQLRSQVHPMPASKELQRDANGQMVRVLEHPPDPSADRMASEGMSTVLRGVIARVIGDAK